MAVNKIRPDNLQPTTSLTWPAGSTAIDEKGISFEGEYECKRKINSGKQVRHRWNRLLLVRNNRNRLSSCAISDIGFWGDRIYNRKTDYIFTSCFKRPIREQYYSRTGKSSTFAFASVFSLMLPMPKNIILTQYGCLKIFAKAFFCCRLS